MKKLFTNSFLLLVVVFGLNCSDQKNESSMTNKTSQPIKNLTIEEIPQLEYGKIVRFPATLVKSLGNDCIEIFVQDDFEKYNGDSKNAIFSRLGSEEESWWWFFGSRKAIVTGKMTFIKDSPDPEKTCGTVTGQFFVITEIEYL